MRSSASAITDDLIDRAATGGAADASAAERRTAKRYPYTALVSLTLVQPGGGQMAPIVIRAKDISLGGLCVTSRQMIHPGIEGAVQLVRSDGRTALIGVRSAYCRYIGGMMHETGLRFVPLPGRLRVDSFLDNRQRLKVDPQLRRAP